MRRGIFLIVLVLLSSLCLATDFISVSQSLVSASPEPGKSVTYELDIQNLQEIDDSLTISYNELSVYPFAETIKDVTIEKSPLDIRSLGNSKAVIHLTVMDSVIPGRAYILNLKLKSLRNPEQIFTYPLVIDVEEPDEYVFVETNFPDSIIPSKEVEFTVKLRNAANLKVNDANIYVLAGDIYSTRFKQTLYGQQEIEKDLIFKVNPESSKGEQTLSVKIYSGEKLIGSYSKKFMIDANTDVDERVETIPTMWGTITQVTKRNNGNVVVVEKYDLKLNSFERMISKYSEEPIKVINNNLYWEGVVKPGETYNLKITTYYKLVYYFVALIILSIMFYFYIMGKGLVIKKSIIKVDAKGGKTRFKVMIHLRNNAGKVLKNVNIADFVPNIISVERERFGTLKPTKIQKGNREFRILWTLETLEKNEERIISYEISSEIKIFGKMILPRASGKYRLGNKRVNVVSNKVISFE